MSSKAKIYTLYRFFNTDKELLYIGATQRSLTARFRDHRIEQPWWHEVADTTTEEFPDRNSMDRAECLAIARENPRYNKRRPHPDQIVRNDDGEIISAGFQAMWIAEGPSHHSFSGLPFAEWEEFDQVANQNGDDRSELIVAFIRAYIRRPGARMPKPPPRQAATEEK